jgi:ubiquinone/menaquinone biosynthesis C-methylase UbiE
MSRNSVERFSDRVENYVKYRPNYPVSIMELFREQMNLKPESVVADIGSGPGISAKLFLEYGNEVYGIEPNAEMRKAADEYLKDFPKFKNIDGTSENTTLADKSVDIIIAAQAFHWFEKDKAREEFKRILKENGFIALIWNERELDSNDFLRDYEKVLLEFGTDYESVRHERITKTVLEEAFELEFKQSDYENAQMLNFEGMKGRILSSSYMPAPQHPRFGELIEKLKSLFAEHQKDDRIQVLYKTNIFYTQF